MEYISREEILAELDFFKREFSECDYAVEAVDNAIRKLPAADVVPVKRGRWKPDSNNCLVCSECGNPAEINGITGEFMESPYCSECGAKMG